MSGKSIRRLASVTKKAAKPRNAAVKATPAKTKVLSGGNPQITNGYGDAPVQAYIAVSPGWKGDVGRRLNAMNVRALPRVRKAAKWNSPFYGVAQGSWFLSFHCMTRYVNVAFFRGAEFDPMPPGASKQELVRYLDTREGEAIDEAQLVDWVKQASRLPGERM